MILRYSFAKTDQFFTSLSAVGSSSYRCRPRARCWRAASQVLSRQYLSLTLVAPDAHKNTLGFVLEQSGVSEKKAVASGEQPAPIDETAAPLSKTPPSVSRRSGWESKENLPILPVMALSEPHYYTIDELTVRPFVLEDVPSSTVFSLPDVPPEPILIQLLINEFGEVDRVLLEATPFSEEVERFVMDSFSKLKFYPGKLSEQPVKSQMSIEVTLEPASASSIPILVTPVY